jgi:hypothetical protein
MRILFTISLLELFIGGGGRLIHVGLISLRMVLFALCLCATVVAIMFPRRKSDGLMLAISLALAYLVIHVGGMLVGAIYSGDTPKIFGEFQQSLYWLAAPFLALMLQSEGDVEKTARLVVLSGLILTFGYLAIVVALITGVVGLGMARSLLTSGGEVQFRSGEFFIYKGFLYLGIAAVFLVAYRRRFWIPLVIIVAIAMVLTFTRGFLLSGSVAIFGLLCAQRRWRTALPALILMGAGVLFLWVYVPSTEDVSGGRYEASTNQRLQDIGYMIDHVTANTLITGEGYASLIDNRYQIENTFLWVLWKLGVVGLVFWIVPFLLCVRYYFKISDRRTNPAANAYMFGVVLIYVQTNMNPFLNNPIGLSFVLVALFSLRTLARITNAPPPQTSPSGSKRSSQRELSSIEHQRDPHTEQCPEDEAKDDHQELVRPGGSIRVGR